MIKTTEVPQEIQDIQFVTRSRWNPDIDSKIFCFLSDGVDGSVLEIGCNRGGTTYMLAVRNRERMVIGIDNYADESMLKGEEIGIETRDLLNVVIIHHDSRTFNYDELNAVKFILVDADHSYENVKKDTDKAIQYLKKHSGGVIAWHDFENPVLSGVTKYVKELSQSMEITHFVGSWTAYTIIEPDSHERT